MKLEFTLYESTGIVDAPGPTQIKVKERRTPDDPVTRVTPDYDPTIEEITKHPIKMDRSHIYMDEFRPSSIERTWNHVIRNSSNEIVYRGEIEKLFVRNTVTDRDFRLVSFKVRYCGPGSEAGSFRMAGTEEDRKKAEKAMLLFAERDAGRRQDA